MKAARSVLRGIGLGDGARLPDRRLEDKEIACVDRGGLFVLDWIYKSVFSLLDLKTLS
jgi:hypothetical protein